MFWLSEATAQLKISLVRRYCALMLNHITNLRITFRVRGWREHQLAKVLVSQRVIRKLLRKKAYIHSDPFELLWCSDAIRQVDPILTRSAFLSETVYRKFSVMDISDNILEVFDPIVAVLLNSAVTKDPYKLRLTMGSHSIIIPAPGTKATFCEVTTMVNSSIQDALQQTLSNRVNTMEWIESVRERSPTTRRPNVLGHLDHLFQCWRLTETTLGQQTFPLYWA